MTSCRIIDHRGVHMRRVRMDSDGARDLETISPVFFFPNQESQTIGVFADDPIGSINSRNLIRQ